MRKKTAAALTALLLFLSACGEKTAEVSETPPASNTPSQPEASVSVPVVEAPSADEGPVNPLTGLTMSEEQAAARPVAVMLNNLKAAQPQQGNSQADIIYEIVTEGGITRMLGLYQSVDEVGLLGSVRSARSYFLDFALGHDAIYIHAGGSTMAYDALEELDADHMDGVNGPYSYAGAGLFWRDRNRVEGKSYDYEHSLVTSGEAIRSALEESGFRLELEEDFAPGFRFEEDGTPAEGEAATVIRVPFSGYKTGVFRYDGEKGVYLAEQYGEAYIDGNTGEQVAVTNVLVLRADIWNVGDSAGHIGVDLSGGDGWFACGGRLIPITWEKGEAHEPFRCYTPDGEPLLLGQGKSYINIISNQNEIEFEAGE